MLSPDSNNPIRFMESLLRDVGRLLVDGGVDYVVKEYYVYTLVQNLISTLLLFAAANNNKVNI